MKQELTEIYHFYFQIMPMGLRNVLGNKSYATYYVAGMSTSTLFIYNYSNILKIKSQSEKGGL